MRLTVFCSECARRCPVTTKEFTLEDWEHYERSTKKSIVGDLETRVIAEGWTLGNKGGALCPNCTAWKSRPAPSPEKPQKPTVGRTVHFVVNHKHVPAIIHDPRVDPLHALLAVFIPPGLHYLPAVYDPNGIEGTWHWPERE